MGDKNTKKDYINKAAAEKIIETAKKKIIANWKVYLGILVAILILLNVLSSMVGSRFAGPMTREIAALKSELATLDARVSETEKGTIDVDAVKDDIAAIKKAGEDFHNRLNALVKAEEEKLTRLERDAADQKTYIDELKSLQK